MWIKRALKRGIFFYQRAISSHRMPCCRYIPSCSNYALEALERFNVFKAVLLSLWRILRCNPLCRGGYDPPERYDRFWTLHRPPILRPDSLPRQDD